MKEKQIQIDKSIFIDLYILINDIKQGYEIDNYRFYRIEKALEDKFQALLKRSAFTQYKTAEPNTAQREQLRQEYLELAGTHKSIQSTTEVQI